MTPQARFQTPTAGAAGAERDESEWLRLRVGEDEVGPANHVIAKLALAIAAEHGLEDAPLHTGATREPRWPLVKTLAVLGVGCGLFWLLAIVAIGMVL
jgi:hypothetical protein